MIFSPHVHLCDGTLGIYTPHAVKFLCNSSHICNSVLHDKVRQVRLPQSTRLKSHIHPMPKDHRNRPSDFDHSLFLSLIKPLQDLIPILLNIKHSPHFPSKRHLSTTNSLSPLISCSNHKIVSRSLQLPLHSRPSSSPRRSPPPSNQANMLFRLINPA